MSTLLTLLFPALIVFMLAMPLVPMLRGVKSGKKVKRSVIFNLCGFFGIVLLMVLFPVGDFVALAATDAASVPESVSQAVNMSTGVGLAYLAAAIAGGMSAIGAGIAVASAAPAAIGATSEDPKSFGKAMIFVVLGEGVAIYGLLIAILIINKLPGA